MSEETDIWGNPIPICRQKKPNVPYQECDCPVHDWVAKLLDIDSIRVNGYKSSKTREHDKAVKLLVPSKVTPKEKRALIRAAGNTARVPIITAPKPVPASYQARKTYKRVRPNGEYIYEMGNPKPVDFIPTEDWDDGHSDSALARIDNTTVPDLVWNPSLYTWVDSDGQPFERIMDPATGHDRLVYRKNGAAITRSVASLSPESLEAVVRDMWEEMREIVRLSEEADEAKLVAEIKKMHAQWQQGRGAYDEGGKEVR